MTGYADDTMLVVRSRQYKDLKRKGNNALAALDGWARTNNLKFAAEKSDVVFFGKRPQQRGPSFRLGGGWIRCRDSIKYLGIHIHNRLNFKEHIQRVTFKTRYVTNRIAAAAKLTWGIRAPALVTILEGAIQPAMMYGAEIWSEKCGVRENRKLLSAQRTLVVKAAHEPIERCLPRRP
ncbi:hypothetical protein PPYR_02058 [Photinus pyralis]|uniref:Reverse transcriptase domain-containing protein n=1 Tax=Photinus pyralis TaxID=7054 RepID=A0A5N4B6A5_PHOPY|nr:hypothetical protein PPYR_02058 [Photinus pyralis]